MDGVINIYKPQGMTSFSCVSRVRKLTKAAKAGHAGTLDPQAAGVLPVCLGKATRCVDLFLNMPKRYQGEITFGIRTDTCDIWGEPVEKLELCDERLLRLDRETVTSAAEQFSGEIMQAPPDYAAVKIDGVPAYKLARQGKQFEMRSRTVTIYEISVLNFWRDAGAYPKAIVDVTCARGTYIRSLFRDIGERLGTYACMSALERKEYGFMKITDAVTLEQLEEAEYIPLYPIGYLLKESPYIVLDATEERQYRNGVCVRITNPFSRIKGIMENGNLIRVYTRDERLLATAKILLYDNNSLELQPNKFFDCKEEPCFE